MRNLLFVITYFLLTNFNVNGQNILAESLDSLQVTSPNGKLLFVFSVKDAGNEKSVPFYQISYQSQPIIHTSRLGLKTNPNGFRYSDWYKDLKLVKIERKSQRSSWKPAYGERDEYPDNFNETTFSLQKGKSIMQIIVRAYNEGVAFRYHFPEDLSTQILEFSDELTYFSLPKATKAWHTQEAQSEYTKSSLKDWKRDAELPLTLELSNGLYASIAQAEQVNYPRVRLKTTKTENVLKTQVHGEMVETSPFSSSWRVVMVAEKIGDLLENNYIILNLNPVSAIKDSSWIKPGLVMRESKLSTSNAKALVDFAVEQELDYIHFDAGWYGYEYDITADASKVDVDPRRNPKKDLDLQEAIRYAKSKGKGVILYVNHRALEKQLDEILPLYKSWGVAGIKFGFVHTGSQHWSIWLHEAVKKAAKYNLIVDIHDEYRPTGFSRTYPNLLTQEGVLGNEGFPDATHNTILPFTRYLAGAGDYTFCFNVESLRPGKVKTTKAHQLALPILYYSPLQFLFWYGSPELYTNREEIAFWKGMPTVWDETKVINGIPGEFVSIARRKGQTWYLGSITNTSSRKTSIKFDFLAKNKTYKAEVYEDQGGNQVKKRFINVTSSSEISFDLEASGGVAIKIVVE